MGFNAIAEMHKWNNEERFTNISGEKGPKIPEYKLEKDNREIDLAGAVRRFLVESCEDLRFDKEKADTENKDVKPPVFGGNSGGETIPVNMEKDIDRICLVNAMDRFIVSGMANDAFDVYFCYLEMFAGERGYRESDDGIWEIIRNAHIVIVANILSMEKFQEMVVNTTNGHLYYYSPEGGPLEDYITYGHTDAFGKNDDIFTDENIVRKQLVKEAMRLNKKYEDKLNKKCADNGDGEAEWNNLSGFLQASNISSADFMEVLRALPDVVQIEEKAELEHIRWCRFLYLNYWEYGVPENGENSDNEKRIHKDLIPYKELSETEKEKDRDIVKQGMNFEKA